MTRVRILVLSLTVASILLPAPITSAGDSKWSKSRGATGTLRLSRGYTNRTRANSAKGSKTLAPSRSRSIAETIKRTYGQAKQKQKNEAARRTREVVELYKQTEERKAREVLRKIKQNSQRSESGSLTLKQPSKDRSSSNGAKGSKRLVETPVLIPPRDEQETKVFKLFAPSNETSKKEKESKSTKILKTSTSKNGK